MQKRQHNTDATRLHADSLDSWVCLYELDLPKSGPAR